MFSLQGGLHLLCARRLLLTDVKMDCIFFAWPVVNSLAHMPVELIKFDVRSGTSDVKPDKVSELQEFCGLVQDPPATEEGGVSHIPSPSTSQLLLVQLPRVNVNFKPRYVPI